jgi:hypothetical protein
MTVAYIEPKVKVTCPSCRAERKVSARQQRRINTGLHDRRCYWCRNSIVKTVSDTHLRYWLRLYGSEIPNQVTPREWIAQNGLPPALAQLAAEFLDDLTITFQAA